MSPWREPEVPHVCKLPWAEIGRHETGEVWECDVCEEVYKLRGTGAGNRYFEKVTWE